MTALANLKRRRAQHVCIYGDPKTGKSTIVSLLAEAGFKLLWVSVDNGHDVLFKLSTAAQANVEVVCLPDTKDNPIAIVTLLKVITGRRCDICDAHGIEGCFACKKEKADFTSVCLNELDDDTIVVFDHVSQVADSAMHYIINRRTSKLSGDAKDEYKAEWDDYRLQGTLMTRFLTNIQQARYHVICIAHVVETEMEDGKKKLLPQIGTTSYSRTAGKYFDHLVYCSMFNKSHRFGSATTYDNNAVTGSRSDVAIELTPKEQRITLAPFFNKEMLQKLAAAEDKQVAALLIRQAAKLQEEITELEATKEHLEDVVQELTSSKEVTKGAENLDNQAPAVVAVGANKEPEKVQGKEVNTPRLEQAVEPTNVAAVEVAPAMTPAERAKAALAKLKGGK